MSIVTCVCFTPLAAVVQMSSSNYSVGEGDMSVEVCVELTSLPTGGLEREISVTLNFSDGLYAGTQYCSDAPTLQSVCSLIIPVSGVDYNGTMVVVVFPILSSVQGDSVCADVVIIDDNALECEQNFTVRIYNATLGTAVLGQTEAVVSIIDNDGK